MSGSNATVNSVRGTSTLVRPRFEPGMLLQHEDLDQLSAYTRELNQLMFRSLFGCGVVCGLVVKTDQSCGKDYIVVGSGLALDSCGNPIYLPKDQRVVIDEHCDQNLAPPLWVILCRTSKCCAPRTAICASDDDETTSVCTREREGFEIRVVRRRPLCVCQCESPDDQAGAPDDAADDAADDGYPDDGTPDAIAARNATRSVDPRLDCYRDHYLGQCGCDCDDCAGGSCDCDCVLLALLERDEVGDPWTADHSVRRFIRPLLMRDPQVASESRARAAAQVPMVVAAVTKPKEKSDKPKRKDDG
jgi:hypothetical protein